MVEGLEGAWKRAPVSNLLKSRFNSLASAMLSSHTAAGLIVAGDPPHAAPHFPCVVLSLPVLIVHPPPAGVLALLDLSYQCFLDPLSSLSRASKALFRYQVGPLCF